MKNTDDNSAPEAAQAGRLESWGSRVFLCDAPAGFFSLREQMIREIGPEFTADVFYQAGTAAAERMMAFLGCREGDGPACLARALALLTEAGYGRVGMDDGPPRAGEVGLRVEAGVESEMVQGHAGRAGYVCDYMRGLLRGIVQNLPRGGEVPDGVLECVEIGCVANDDAVCRFVVATQDHLTQHGYRVGDSGYSSVRETLLRLNRQLEDVLEAAKRDALTGLYNRSHFESALRHKIEYANRRTDTLAVAMIDIDGFKQVNDAQGHGMGDLALRQVGGLLAGHARDTDVVARYGGDEFAWLMPGTSVEAALAVADRIRRLVGETQESFDLPISLSIGIAACPEDAASMADLVDLADAAMYLAKDSGGNQVRRYVASEDHRTAAQRRVRKPRPRPTPAAPAKPPAADIKSLRLDLQE